GTNSYCSAREKEALPATNPRLAINSPRSRRSRSRCCLPCRCNGCCRRTRYQYLGHWLYEVVEDVVGNRLAAGNPVVPVERPVDPQVNAALAIFEGGLAEAVKSSGHDRPHLAIRAPRYAVKLIRNKGKGDIVPAI